MTRRASRVAVVVAMSSLLAAACQPSVPLLTDPRAIVEAAAASTATASSVRIDLVAEGELVIDPLGTGAGAPIELRGTSASVDIDLAGGDARATFAAPGLLGLAGELISVDGTTYLKTSLTGTRYQVVASPGEGPTPSPDRASMLAALTDLLARPELDPRKGDDVPCGTGTCYTVTIALTAADLASLGVGDLPIPPGLPIPLPDLSTAGVDVTLRVEQSTTRLAGLTGALDLGDAGALSIEATFTKWDEPVSVTAPPPGEVAPGS